MLVLTTVILGGKISTLAIRVSWWINIVTWNETYLPSNMIELRILFLCSLIAYYYYYYYIKVYITRKNVFCLWINYAQERKE